MNVEMLMPQMGESITEGTISRWRKQAGERVEKDEIILEISTDKVDSEIPAPAAGILAQLLAQEGQVVPVKSVIAIIDTAGKASASAPAAIAPTAAAVATPNAEGADEQNDEASAKYLSPLVKSLAQKHGIALDEVARIPGTGQGGRVNKQDFLEYVKTRTAPATPAAVAPVAPAQPAAQAAPQAAARVEPSSKAAPVASKKPTQEMPSLDWQADGTKVVAMDTMRQAIAEHMVRSKHTSPHVYSIQEVDVSKVARWRQQHKAEFQDSFGFSLSFTPFFLEAATKALLKFPYVNSSVDGKRIILKRHVNLGCAVALPNAGLIVPVIKHAEEKNFVGLARGLNDLAQRARTKKLLPDDVSGGSFTVTNPGVFGTIIGTPIINQPQVAILCLGAIVKRPVVIDDMIGIREMCYLTLSYDHRIIDGAIGGQFLAFVREYLENWDMERGLY